MAASPCPIAIGLGRLPTGPGPDAEARQPFEGTSHPSPLLCQNYQLHSGEVNGGLPSVSGFSSASTPYGVSSHTPPISGTDSMMGTYGAGARGGPQHHPPRSTAVHRSWKIKVSCKPLMLEAVISVSDVPGHFLSPVCHCAWSCCVRKRRSEVIAAGYLGRL